jgi:hypothetical protein
LHVHLASPETGQGLRMRLSCGRRKFSLCIDAIPTRDFTRGGKLPYF